MIKVDLINKAYPALYNKKLERPKINTTIVSKLEGLKSEYPLLNSINRWQNLSKEQIQHAAKYINCISKGN